MSHKKSINKRLAAEKAIGAVEKDIAGNTTNGKSKSKKNKQRKRMPFKKNSRLGILFSLSKKMQIKDNVGIGFSYQNE